MAANEPRPFNCWQAPDRDSIHVLSSGVLDEKTAALIRMEGLDGHDEEAVAAVSGMEIRRPRRPHKALERMGVLFRSDGLTRLTELGHLLSQAEAREEVSVRRIRRAALSVLKKFQLKNPADEAPNRFYPDDCDIHPYWAMWKAASQLDWRLHWDELNRELMRVLKTDELDAAIERIRRAREEPDYDPARGGAQNAPLGARCHDEEAPADGRDADGQVRDHFCTPFFRRAGFGEVFFKSLRNGYYEVPEEVRNLVLAAVEPPPDFVRFEDADEWLEYYGSVPHEPLRRALRPNWNAGPPDLGPLRGLNEAYEVAATALRAGKHVILFGAPGTGKSELALQLCHGHGITPFMSTATGDWTTFDTIGGYLPDPRLGEDGNDPLNFFPGAFLRSIERENWLIVDELNRADIDKAFGELFTVLSGHSVSLPYLARDGNRLRPVVIGPSQDPGDFSIEIPRDWRILGTMNTFDKASLFQLSFAFMRRFAFVPVGIPEEGVFRTIVADEIQRARDDDVDGDEFWMTLAELTSDLFATENGALAKVGPSGVRVGPAIAIDVIRYACQRLRLPGDAAQAKRVLVEALPLYLLPQFEGRHREHPAIVAALQEVLELGDEATEKLDQELRAWTGHDPVRE